MPVILYYFTIRVLAYYTISSYTSRLNSTVARKGELLIKFINLIKPPLLFEAIIVAIAPNMVGRCFSTNLKNLEAPSVKSVVKSKTDLTVVVSITLYQNSCVLF